MDHSSSRFWKKVIKKSPKGRYLHGLYYMIYDYFDKIKEKGFDLTIHESQEASYALIGLEPLQGMERHIRIDSLYDTTNKYLVPYHLTRTIITSDIEYKERGYFFFANELETAPTLQQLTCYRTNSIINDQATKDALCADVVDLGIPIIKELLAFRNSVIDDFYQEIEVLEEELRRSSQIFTSTSLDISVISSIRTLLNRQKEIYEKISLYSNQQVNQSENLPIINLEKIITLLDAKLSEQQHSNCTADNPPDVFAKSPSSASQELIVRRNGKKIKKKHIATTTPIHPEGLKRSFELLREQLLHHNHTDNLCGVNEQLLLLNENLQHLLRKPTKFNKIILEEIAAIQQQCVILVEAIKCDNVKRLVTIKENLDAYADLLNQIDLNKKTSSKIFVSCEEPAKSLEYNEILNHILEFARNTHEAQVKFFVLKLDDTALPPELLAQKNALILDAEAKGIFSLTQKYLPYWISVAICESSVDTIKELMRIYPVTRKIMGQLTDDYKHFTTLYLPVLLKSKDEISSSTLILNMAEFCFEISESYRKQFLKNILEAFPLTQKHSSTTTFAPPVQEHMSKILELCALQEKLILFNLIVKHASYSHPLLIELALKQLIDNPINQAVLPQKSQDRIKKLLHVPEIDEEERSFCIIS